MSLASPSLNQLNSIKSPPPQHWNPILHLLHFSLLAIYSAFLKSSLNLLLNFLECLVWTIRSSIRITTYSRVGFRKLPLTFALEAWEGKAEVVVVVIILPPLEVFGSLGCS